MSGKQWFVEAKDVARLQWLPFCTTVGVLAAIYVCSVFIAPGFWTYALSVLPALCIAITALVRVNDIGPENMGWRWHMRRVGLVMAGTGSVMLLGAPFTDFGWAIPWRTVVLVWGVALAWFTTPGLPPWEDYILGLHRGRRAGDQFKDFAGRVTGTHRVKDLKRRLGDGDGP